MAEDSWSALPDPPSRATRGVAHQNKLFLFYFKQPALFDPTDNKWSLWPIPPFAMNAPCLVSWRDSVLAFGAQNVLKYNSTAEEWSILADGSAPFTMDFPSCVLLPNDQILIAGSLNSGSIALYDIANNSWEQIEYQDANGPELVNLNGRIFLIGELGLEYHYQNKSWTLIETNLTYPRELFSAASVPAVLFSNLPGGCEGIA